LGNLRDKLRRASVICGDKVPGLWEHVVPIALNGVAEAVNTFAGSGSSRHGRPYSRFASRQRGHQ
jgi:hypothetical protein